VIPARRGQEGVGGPSEGGGTVERRKPGSGARHGGSARLRPPGTGPIGSPLNEAAANRKSKAWPAFKRRRLRRRHNARSTGADVIKTCARDLAAVDGHRVLGAADDLDVARREHLGEIRERAVDVLLDRDHGRHQRVALAVAPAGLRGARHVVSDREALARREHEAAGRRVGHRSENAGAPGGAGGGAHPIGEVAREQVVEERGVPTGPGPRRTKRSPGAPRRARSVRWGGSAAGRGAGTAQGREDPAHVFSVGDHRPNGQRSAASGADAESTPNVRRSSEIQSNREVAA